MMWFVTGFSPLLAAIFCHISGWDMIQYIYFVILALKGVRVTEPPRSTMSKTSGGERGGVVSYLRK